VPTGVSRLPVLTMWHTLLFSSARIFLAYVASPDGTGDEVAGVATCFMGWGTFAGKPLVNVHDLATLPQWRRRGVGKALLQAAVDCARREGCGKVTLEAYPHNAGAVALYKSFGFDAQARACVRRRQKHVLTLACCCACLQMHFFELKLMDV
jgi:GNAT superfamily N-acetyltransferase